MNEAVIDSKDRGYSKENHAEKRIILKGMSLPELQSWCLDRGESRFRGIQLFEWMYRHGATDVESMTNVKKSFRDYLAAHTELETLRIEKISESQLEPTRKFLFKTRDDRLIESVSIIDGDRHTVCLSTQIGCNVGCDFCATASMGFTRNLSTGEIVDQLLHVKRRLPQPVTNVVFMGMGEPFLNYDRTLSAADIFHDPRGMNLASVRITISTAGILPKIKQFIKERRKYKLAISLNAADDATRTKLMPLNARWPIRELVKTGMAFSHIPRRQVMFEYVLIKGMNDSPRDARKLDRLLNGIPCKLNIIPYNESNGKYCRPDDETIHRFSRILFENQHAYRVLVRWSKGRDIDAACGQLAAKSINNDSERKKLHYEHGPSH